MPEQFFHTLFGYNLDSLQALAWRNCSGTVFRILRVTAMKSVLAALLASLILAPAATPAFVVDQCTGEATEFDNSDDCEDAVITQMTTAISDGGACGSCSWSYCVTITIIVDDNTTAQYNDCDSGLLECGTGHERRFPCPGGGAVGAVAFQCGNGC